jgi:hypothetical protein
MREVAPGDLVFSFADAWIRALGLVQSHAYEAPKPVEFGSAGRNWEDIGWRVEVDFRVATKPFRPRDWIELLRPLLPARYSPLQANGRGLQQVYLTELPQPLALALARLLGPEAEAIARSEAVGERRVLASRPDLWLWEEHIERRIRADASVPETEKVELVRAPATASLGETARRTRNASTGRTACC